jgi:uncharacterized protein (TIGR04141 family)
MPAVSEIRSMTLSLRLLREGRSVADSLRSDSGFEESRIEGGRLFIGQTPATPPSWVAFVGQFVLTPSTLPRLVGQSCGAVLFLEVMTDDAPPIKRTMALSFGTGHHALEPDAFERGFGLRVVLNSVARSSLRSLDIATLDATTFLRRIQASRDADLQGFGVDTDRDLLTLAAGSPRDLTFARSLAGRDALSLNTRTSRGDVMEKCKTALKLYQAQDYKRDFGFIDYVSPVRRRDLVEQLDMLALAELCGLVNGGSSDLHIALPDILDPEEEIDIGYYGVGLKSGAKPAHNQLAIEDYVAELQAGDFSQITDMAELRASHEVRVIVDGEGDKKRKRKIYECFVFEVEHQGIVYVLFGGEWFAVDKAFHASVEVGFNRLLSATPFIASTATTNEREFIAELDGHRNLLNLDQVKLNPQGMSGASLEPCDFLSTKREFIHLKDGHGSAPISHLWNQGVVSAEAFVRDEKFRKDLRAATKRRQRKSKKHGFERLLPDGRSKPAPSDYAVVFGIMRSRYRKSNTLGIPFFSKISLRAVADRIELMGYKVEVHLIEKLAGAATNAPTAKAA